MSDSAKAWIVQAVFDLESAITLYENRLWGNACLSAQQAAEKFGKALLIHADVMPDHTHNVAKIIEEIERIGLRQFSDAEKDVANALTKTFLTSRYPNLGLGTAPCEMFSKGDAKSHIAWALEFFDMAIHIAPDLVERSAPGRRGDLQRLLERAEIAISHPGRN